MQSEDRDPAKNIINGDGRETENVFFKEEPAPVVPPAEGSLQMLEDHGGTKCVIQVDPSTTALAAAGSISQWQGDADSVTNDYTHTLTHLHSTVSAAGSISQWQGDADSITNDCTHTHMHSTVSLETALSQPSFGGPHSMLRHGYSLSQSPRIQQLQFELGFIDEITAFEGKNVHCHITSLRSQTPLPSFLLHGAIKSWGVESENKANIMVSGVFLLHA